MLILSFEDYSTSTEGITWMQQGITTTKKILKNGKIEHIL